MIEGGPGKARDVGETVVFGFRPKPSSPAPMSPAFPVAPQPIPPSRRSMTRSATGQLAQLEDRDVGGRSASTEEPVRFFRFKGIHKTFGGVVAIDRFDLDIYAGEVVALVGDNGAENQRWSRLLLGFTSQMRGRFRSTGTGVDDRSERLPDARDPGRLSDLALADNQPVYMNMFLGREQVTVCSGGLTGGKWSRRPRLWSRSWIFEFLPPARPSKIFPAARGKASRSQERHTGLRGLSQG